MNEHPFLHWLQTEIESSGASPRTIIRLHASTDCREIVRNMHMTFGEHPVSASIQALPIINSISCPIHSGEAALGFPQVAGVEMDRTALVHGVTARLPSFGAASVPYAATRPFIPWGVQRIQAPLAWKKSTGDKIKIGVIDTGIDYTHPDLQASIGGGINLIERHLPPVDDNGHGTHISGTIAASSSHGMTGTAPYATLYAVKAFDHNGSSYVTDIVHGIEWCIRNRMHIINMSFGMKTRSPALEAAIQSAHKAGIIVVASAGNEGKKSFVDYPARFPQTIAVGATTRSKRIASFSNRGPEINLYAPGEKIISTWLNGKYNALSGTSMATSHVSGVIALLLSLKPQYTTRTILDQLQKHSTPVASMNRRSGFLGEVNAVRPIRAAVQRKKRSSG
ncbi:S8 family peptidase [Gorillibacterium sp. sgz5001074]|uniref:S8 family peptidase n=1 Tax=Gorillibacterium sp. sgz5001074 TaxID=3446695 RepID=UPI003F67DB62